MKTPTTSTASEAPPRRWTYRLRQFCVGLFIAVSCLALGIFVVVHWVERQVLTTDNWVALVSPLPRKPVVATALGNTISDQVFQSDVVENKIKNALPPRADFLAKPLTDQLKGLTTKASQRLVAGDAFQAIWTGANRLAMNRLVTMARGQTPPLQARIEQRFNVNISSASGQLGQAVGSAAAAIPALQPASKQALTLTADLHARRERVHQVIRTTDTLAKILPWAFVASLLGALALSGRRRRTALIVAVSLIVLMLVELIALKLLRQTVLNQVRNPGNLQAVGYVYDVLINGLKHMIYVVLIVVAALVLGLFAGGPARWAVTLRSFIHLERLRGTRFMAVWHAIRQWAKVWEYYLWLGAAIIVLGSLALFAQVTGQAIVNAVLLVIGLVALIHIIGTPPWLRNNSPLAAGAKK